MLTTMRSTRTSHALLVGEKEIHITSLGSQLAITRKAEAVCAHQFHSQGYTRENITHVHKKTCTTLFIASLFVNVKY